MIIHAMTASFGKLQNETLTLKPGLNVIHAPNEWGKSTWCAFLLAMLYGIDTSARASRGVLPDKTRYAPWSGAPMSGRMNITWQGRDITIERSTKGRIPMGQFAAYETQSHLPVPELTAENCGLKLLGVERSVFLRAGFLRFSDLPVTADETLRQRLNALVTTGDESGDAETLSQKLKALKNACRHNTTGQLPQAEAEAMRIQRALDELEGLGRQIDTVKAQQKELCEQEKLLLNHREALAYEASREYRRQLSAAQAKAEMYEEQLKTLEAQGRGLPPAEELETNLSQAQRLQEAWEGLQSQAQLLPPPPSQPVPPLPFRGLTGEEAILRAEEDAAAYDRLEASHPTPFRGYLLPGAGILLLGVVLLVLRQWISGGVAALLGLAALAGGFYLAKSKAQKIQQENEKRAKDFLSLYAPLAPGTWADAARDYSRKLESYEAALTTSAAARQELQEKMGQVQGQIREIGGNQPLSGIIRSLQGDLQLHRDLEEARKRWDTARETAETLRKAQKEVPPPQMPDSLTYSEAQTRQFLEGLEIKKHQAQLILGNLQGRMAALGQPEELERQKALVDGRIALLKDWQAALELSLTTLEAAKNELQRRFAPQISRRAQELFSRLTGGRYNRLTLGTDFGLQVAAQEDVTLHSAQYPSDGTVDQLYLSLRLAVAEALTPEAPLILDDALVRFDDDRLKIALEVLGQEAKEKQVLLFTCQSREGSYVKP